MNSASSARNRNTELAAVDDPTPIPPKKKRLTNTHCQRRIETTSKSSLCTLIRVHVVTIIFIYLNNMDSVSSTGDRDVQPAAVDD